MATVSYTIYSHYEPKKPDRYPEASTSYDQLEVESAHDPWQTESSFPASRLLDTAPRFVPATIPFDQWGAAPGIQKQARAICSDEMGKSPAGWYRSLTGGRGRSDPVVQQDPVELVSRPSNTLNHTQDIPQPRLEKRNKNNWFIHRAIQSEPTSLSSTPPPTQTLADILERDPPPLPTEEAYRPLVWLAIGPSNKGFAMLQQSGWNEGEGLGAHIRRRARPNVTKLEERRAKRARSEELGVVVKQESRKLTWDDDVQEVQHVEVIDLTSSDPEDEVEFDVSGPTEDILEELVDHIPDTPITVPAEPSQSWYSPTALLTPIPTVLKSDRLGIGLKAKTTGPYKASQKRVTHNAAALAAHIKAAEETRRKKAEVGRGHRGFSKIAKKERETRQKMLAYLNE